MPDFETPIKFNQKTASLLLGLGLPFNVGWDGAVSFPENMVFMLNEGLSPDEDTFLKHINALQKKKYPYQPPANCKDACGAQGLSVPHPTRKGLFILAGFINIQRKADL